MTGGNDFGTCFFFFIHSALIWHICVLPSLQSAFVFHPFYSPHLSSISEQDSWQKIICVHSSKSPQLYTKHIQCLISISCLYSRHNLTRGIVRTSKITETKCLAQAHLPVSVGLGTAADPVNSKCHALSSRQTSHNSRALRIPVIITDMMQRMWWALLCVGLIAESISFVWVFFFLQQIFN